MVNMVRLNMMLLLMALKHDVVESHNEVVATVLPLLLPPLMALIMNTRYMEMLIHLIARLLVMM
jgi:hypothetical protein